MKITKTSMFSGKSHSMDLPITQEQLDEFTSRTSGRLVQEIFPNLTSSQREFLMTGATEGEWDEAFPPDEDE